MIKTNVNISGLAFVESLENDIIKCHRMPNHGEEFYGYREKVSVYHFREYLYSLRYINDFENSGGVYLGY